MKISVCIPMYNESAVCCECARALYDAMRARESEYDWEVIFCDDGSSDQCGKKLCEYVRSLGTDKIKVTGYAENRGKGAAVRHAVLTSTGDFVVYTDCDLAYGTDVIFSAAEMIGAGADMVVGSRNLDGNGYGGYSAVRRFASRAYIKAITVLAGFRLSDSQCGFKAFDGTAARKIFSACKTDGFSFDLEVIEIGQKMGLTIREMPVRIINHRDSKIHLVSDAVGMLGDIRKIKKRVKKLDIS